MVHHQVRCAHALGKNKSWPMLTCFDWVMAQTVVADSERKYLHCCTAPCLNRALVARRDVSTRCDLHHLYCTSRWKTVVMRIVWTERRQGGRVQSDLVFRRKSPSGFQHKTSLAETKP